MTNFGGWDGFVRLAYESDPFALTCLAVDALANSDPKFLQDIYNNGGKIEDVEIMNLATAEIRSRRKNTDPLDEYHKIKAKGW